MEPGYHRVRYVVQRRIFLVARFPFAGTLVRASLERGEDFSLDHFDRVTAASTIFYGCAWWIATVTSDQVVISDISAQETCRRQPVRFRHAVVRQETEELLYAQCCHSFFTQTIHELAWTAAN